jgi:hypothetical protein
MLGQIILPLYSWHTTSKYTCVKHIYREVCQSFVLFVLEYYIFENLFLLFSTITANLKTLHITLKFIGYPATSC